MRRRAGIEPDLERALTRYLQLRIGELEQSAQAQEQVRRTTAMRSMVGQLVTWLLLLAGYALALGLTSRAQLIRALLTPQELVQNFQISLEYAGRAAGSLPDALRGLFVTGLSTVALLVFRAASFSVRADIGGAIFVGVVSLALVGLSAATSSGPLGLMASLPGFAAAVVIVHQLLNGIQDFHDGTHPASSSTPSTPMLGRLQAWITSALKWIDPARAGWLTTIFLILPWVSLLVVSAAVITSGGPMFLPARVSMFLFGAWCLWAFVATPRVIRISLWSILPWSALFLTQFAFDPVAEVFSLAVIGLLFINVVDRTIHLPHWGAVRPESRDEDRQPSQARVLSARSDANEASAD